MDGGSRRIVTENKRRRERKGKERQKGREKYRKRREKENVIKKERCEKDKAKGRVKQKRENETKKKRRKERCKWGNKKVFSIQLPLYQIMLEATNYINFFLILGILKQLNFYFSQFIFGKFIKYIKIILFIYSLINNCKY